VHSADLIEVAPGRWRAADVCTPADLERARALAAERLRTAIVRPAEAG
jgi:hypothetical protein